MTLLIIILFTPSDKCPHFDHLLFSPILSPPTEIGECLNSVHGITLDSDSNVGEELGDSDGMIVNVGRQELASTEAAATDNAVADDMCNGTQ